MTARGRPPAEENRPSHTLITDIADTDPAKSVYRITRTCDACGSPLPGKRRRFCCDDHRRRGQRAERNIETSEFGQAALRMIRAMARRVGASDIAEFGLMWEIMTEAEQAVTGTITSLKAAGYSWAQIGAEIGASRQGVQQWYGRRSGVNDPLTVDGGPG